MAALTPLSFLAQEVAWRLSPLAVVILCLLLIALFVWLERRKKLVKAETTAQKAEMPKAEMPKAAAPKATADPIVDSAPALSLTEPAVPAPVASISLAGAAQTPAGEPVEPTRADIQAEVPAAKLSAAGLPGDNLEIIEGIGPKIASVLKQAGVKTFAQLAQMDPAQITPILLAAGLRLADPRSWPEQARLAAAGDLEKLKDLQSHLKAGRIV